MGYLPYLHLSSAAEFLREQMLNRMNLSVTFLLHKTRDKLTQMFFRLPEILHIWCLIFNSVIQMFPVTYVLGTL